MSMTPGDGAKALTEIGKRFSPLRTNIGCHPSEHVASGIAMALHDLWAVLGLHPANIAALALEDANYHKEALELFTIAESKPVSDEESEAVQMIRDHLQGKDMPSRHDMQCFVGMIETGEATLADFRKAGGKELEWLVDASLQASLRG